MAKFVTSLVVICITLNVAPQQTQAACVPDNLFDKDLRFMFAIQDALCLDGEHSDAVSEQYYACYNEAVVPGASQWKTCQLKTYGFELNSQQNVERFCKHRVNMIDNYAVCFYNNIVEAIYPYKGVCFQEALRKINKCQAAAVKAALGRKVNWSLAEESYFDSLLLLV